jgi:hypothetical protein
MYFFDYAECLLSQLSYWIHLTFVIFCFVKCLNCRTNKLNKNNFMPVRGIFTQEKLVTLQLIFEAWDWMIRIDCAHYKRSLNFCSLVPALLLLQALKRCDQRIYSLLVLFHLEAKLFRLDYFLHKGLLNSHVRDPDHHIFTVKIYSEISSFKELKIETA